MKKQLLILGLLLTLLVPGVMGDTTIGGLTPKDNAYTSDQTPEFCAIPVTNESVANISTLYIGGVPYGDQTTITNNTEFCITANASLTYGDHTWYVNVTDNATMNQSASYTLNVARLGETTPIVEEVATGTIPAVVTLFIAVVVVFVILIIVGFILGIFETITGGVNSKFKGKIK